MDSPFQLSGCQVCLEDIGFGSIPAPHVQVKVDDLSTPPLWHSDVVPPASGFFLFRGFRGSCPRLEVGEGVKPYTVI